MRTDTGVGSNQGQEQSGLAAYLHWLMRQHMQQQIDKNGAPLPAPPPPPAQILPHQYPQQAPIQMPGHPAQIPMGPPPVGAPPPMPGGQPVPMLGMPPYGR